MHIPPTVQLSSARAHWLIGHALARWSRLLAVVVHAYLDARPWSTRMATEQGTYCSTLRLMEWMALFGVLHASSEDLWQGSRMRGWLLGVLQRANVVVHRADGRLRHVRAHRHRPRRRLLLEVPATRMRCGDRRCARSRAGRCGAPARTPVARRALAVEHGGQQAMAKKPSCSYTPLLGVSSRRQKMVARMKPVIMMVPTA
jgi:hypothetical protein